jgi:hypothetical protein
MTSQEKSKLGTKTHNHMSYGHFQSFFMSDTGDCNIFYDLIYLAHVFSNTVTVD